MMQARDENDEDLDRISEALLGAAFARKYERAMPAELSRG